MIEIYSKFSDQMDDHSLEHNPGNKFETSGKLFPTLNNHKKFIDALKYLATIPVLLCYVTI